MPIPPLPPTPENLPNLWAELDKFQATFTKIHGSLSEGKNKQMLGELLAQFRTARAEAEKVVPDVVRSMQQKAEQHQANLAEMERSYEEAKANVESMRRAAMDKAKSPRGTPAPKPAPAPVDPHRGAFLAGDLDAALARSRLPEQTGLQDDGSVAALWTEPTQDHESDTQSESPIPEQPPQQSPAGNKRRKNADDESWGELFRE